MSAFAVPVALAVALFSGVLHNRTDVGPTLYVAPNGSDSAVCAVSAPCLTFDRAYHRALPGQVVQVMAGTYPAQTMTYDASKAAATANVVFKTAPGQLAVIGGIAGDGISHITFVGGSQRNLTPARSGVTLKADPMAMDTGGDFELQNCARFVTVQNMDMRQFGINGSDNITLDGGTVGGYDNLGGDSFVGGPYLGRGTSYCTAENPSNIRITHLVFHDVQRAKLPTAHPDCLQFYGTASTVVDGNVFLRCGTSNLIARPNTGPWAGNTIDSLIIQNNFFTPATEGGAVLVLGSHADVCGRVVVDYNTSIADGLSAFDCAKYGSLEIVGNYQNAMTKYLCDQILKKATIYAYNVIGRSGASGSAASCGRSSLTSGDPVFADPAAGNFRISHGSPLTGRGDPALHPPTDIDGRPRPLRAAPDAGAYEWDVPGMQLGVSIGAAKIGMSRAAIENHYGTSPHVSQITTSKVARRERLTVARYSLHGGVLGIFYGPGGIVVGLSTTSPYYAARDGFGVGSPVAKFPEVRRFEWAKCRGARLTTRARRLVYLGLKGGRPAGSAVTSVAFLPPHVPPCN